MKRNEVTNCMGNDTENSTCNFKGYLLALIPFFCHKPEHEKVVTGQVGMCKAAVPTALPWASLTCQLCTANAFKAISRHFSILKSYLSKFPYNIFISRGRQWNLFFSSGDFWVVCWLGFFNAAGSFKEGCIISPSLSLLSPHYYNFQKCRCS